ncbi:hypothetical protein IFM47457_11387 [Aspergillus lentulus]|nr:hypothetical protein IFM47457_11387 [Aspergillus lentulus]
MLHRFGLLDLPTGRARYADTNTIPQSKALDPASLCSTKVTISSAVGRTTPATGTTYPRGAQDSHLAQ